MSPELSELPEWDLSDLYASQECVFKDLESLQSEANLFRQNYKKRSLEQAIKDYENLSERLDRIDSYSELLRAKDLYSQEVSQFYQTVHEKLTEVHQILIFFPLYINETEEDAGKYVTWVHILRRLKPHQLSEQLEQFSMDKDLTGGCAWVRFYDEQLARLKFPWQENRIPLSDLLEFTTHQDASIRREAAHTLSQGLEKESHTFTFIYNTLIQEKRIDDRIRHFSSPQSSRHLHNQIAESDVKALVRAVTSRYKTLSHRYYQLKSEILNLKPFYYWDRNAPLNDTKSIPWAEAKNIVLSAYEAFSPEMAAIGRQFFDNGWIDAKPSPAKTSGAFSHSTVPSAHPYILMSYYGKLRDVMTLAHELGHGIHQVLAAKQGHLLSQTPLTLAETASVFGEMLTFQWLRTRYDIKPLLLSKLDDMMNTVVRQIAFYLFEENVHTQKRELTAEELGGIWLQTQKDALGDAVICDPCIQPYWSYISHFFHTPFYVYAYAFGDCLVNTLYAKYQEEPAEFAQHFIELLQAGGTRPYQEALTPFQLDASHTDFWHKGLDVIEQMINELEKGSAL